MSYAYTPNGYHNGPGSHPRAPRWWNHPEHVHAPRYNQPALPLQYPSQPQYAAPAVMPMNQFVPPPMAMPPAYAAQPAYNQAYQPAYTQPTLPGFPATTVGTNALGSPHFHTNVPPGHYPVPMPYPTPVAPPPVAAPVNQVASVQQQAPLGMQGFTTKNARTRDFQHAMVRTNEHKEKLMNNYSVSWVERMFKGVKEFVWNDFSKHPVMSAGAVFLGYSLFKNLKGTPAGTAVAWGAGLSIAYHLMRDKFGIDPIDKVAETAGVFSPKAESGVRKLFDTIRRPFVGPEGAGSAIGFYMDKLGIKESTDESAVLLGFMQTNVQEFFGWYDGVLNGSPQRIPPTVRQTLNKMYTSSYLSSMSEEQKSALLVNVARKVFSYAGGGNEALGEQSIRSKTLDGSFAGATMNPLQIGIEKRISELPSGSHERRQLHELLVQVKGTIGGTQQMIQRSSTELTMLDAMIIEEDDMMALVNYDGIGASFKEIMAGAKHYTGRGINAVDYYGHKALDGIELGFHKTAAFFNERLEANNLTKDDFKAWYYSDFKPWIKGAKETGSGALADLKKSPVGQLVTSTGNFLKVSVSESTKLTGDALDSFAAQIEGVANSIDEAAKKRQQGGAVV